MLLSDPSTSPYALSRAPLFGRRGAVATSQPLAAQAGMAMLQQGGNAVDAAIATAAALTVVEPTSNGIGSDGFALVWAHGALHGLNASGRAPAGLDRAWCAARGHDTMPARGWAPVTVPGAVSQWVALSERFGRLPFAALLEPSIQLAEGGFPASPIVSRFWRYAHEAFRRTLHGREFEGWFHTFAPGGHTPAPGEVVRFPEIGRASCRERVCLAV